MRSLNKNPIFIKKGRVKLMKKINLLFEISHYDILDSYINDVFDAILGEENIRLKSKSWSYRGYVVAHGDKLESEMYDLERIHHIPKYVSCFFIMAYFYASKIKRSLYEAHHNHELAIKEIKEFIEEFPDVVKKIEDLYMFMQDNINLETNTTIAKEWND